MSVLLEARPYRPFKSSEEYLIAMKEDLAEWLNALYPELMISLDNFMDTLDTGVALCKHANSVRRSASDYVARRQARKVMTRSITSSLAMPMAQLSDVAFLPNAKAGTFFARDNVSNFITWCRNSLGIIECLLFETDDLIMRKNERHVILCLLEVARRGAKFGMLAPMLVQMERQIDREIAADNKVNNASKNLGANSNTHGSNDDDDNEDADDEDEYADITQQNPCLMYGPQPQIVTNDLKSLDEMVRDLVERCTCPTQFPMIRVSEGKYRIGDTKVLIFVRILRSHVMVRVGGGWDTLSHYLDKHDPCRCRTSHRSMISAKLIQKAGGSFDLGSAQVHYERSPPRTRRSSASSVGSCSGFTQQPCPQQQESSPSHQLQMPSSALAIGNRSRSPTPQQSHNRQLQQEQKKMSDRSPSPTAQRKYACSPIRRQLSDLGNTRRSRSPTPKSDHLRFIKSEQASNIERARKSLKEEIHAIQCGEKMHIDHNRHFDDHQDPKENLNREIQEKVPLSEDFAKRYIVEGGVARRAFDAHDTAEYEPTICGYKCGSSPESSSNSGTISSSMVNMKDHQLQPQRNTVTTEDSFANDSLPHYSKSLHAESEHSDNGSEVSDEGYRSLGAAQPTVTSTINNQHLYGTSSAHLHSHKKTENPENEFTDDIHSCVDTDRIETGLRKTRTIEVSRTVSSAAKSPSSIGSSIVVHGNRRSTSRSPNTGSYCSNPTSIKNDERLSRSNSMVRENSNLSKFSSGSQTPRDGNSSPENCGSPSKCSTTNSRNSSKKPPASPTPNFRKSHGISRYSGQVYGASDAIHHTRNENRSPIRHAINRGGPSNTWNGREMRQRPTLCTEVFFKPTNNVKTSITSLKSTSPTNLSRNNARRQSLPRFSNVGTNGNSGITAVPTSAQYDQNGRKIMTSTSTSLQTPPTKIANPFLEQILAKVSHLHDDKEVVEKLQGLIRDYQGHVVISTNDDNETVSTRSTTDDRTDPAFEFTRAWLDGNGTVALPRNDTQLIASPRKDPKPPSERGSGFSRIPAPVYKRSMSFASENI